MDGVPAAKLTVPLGSHLSKTTPEDIREPGKSDALGFFLFDRSETFGSPAALGMVNNGAKTGEGDSWCQEGFRSKPTI
jgi:hypothetical protein